MVLGCKHYGKPANNNVHEYEQKYSKPKRFVANDNGEVLGPMDSTGMKHREATSQSFGCPFNMVLQPLNVHSQQWRIVSFFDGEHNHKLAQEISSYSMARRLDTEEEAIVISMIKSHATNNSILSFLASKNKIIKPKK